MSKDAPTFPKPGTSEETAYRTASTPPEAIAPTSHRPSHAPRTIVTLADPPEEEDPSLRAKPKLSRDEVKALLAVNETTTLTRWGKTTNRLAFAAFPTFFVSVLADKCFGWWGIPITLACGILWALWPMRKQDREGW